MRQPSGGFNDTSLSQVFSHTVARYAATASGISTSTSGANSNPASASPSPPSKSPAPVGLAVGSAVGGVALLGISTAAVFFCVRRRRRRRDPSNDIVEKAELSGHGRILSEMQQPQEVDGRPPETRYELSGDFHGVEAPSQEARVKPRQMVPRSIFHED